MLITLIAAVSVATLNCAGMNGLQTKSCAQYMGKQIKQAVCRVQVRQKSGLNCRTIRCSALSDRVEKLVDKKIEELTPLFESLVYAKTSTEHDYNTRVEIVKLLDDYEEYKQNCDAISIGYEILEQCNKYIEQLLDGNVQKKEIGDEPATAEMNPNRVKESDIGYPISLEEYDGLGLSGYKSDDEGEES